MGFDYLLKLLGWDKIKVVISIPFGGDKPKPKKKDSERKDGGKYL